MAANNRPLYMKFAQPVKDAVRSGILEHGTILPGSRYLRQLTGFACTPVRQAVHPLEADEFRLRRPRRRRATRASYRHLPTDARGAFHTR
ncbi:GntR family transcriptional regulator, partial [Salmonella enterica]|uniref:GntR family transcriptional regulator n=1 Tax=Salmonella enterica TaxID=28901 RepID=UPI00398C778B